jgi:hypothetical protein
MGRVKKNEPKALDVALSDHPVGRFTLLSYTQLNFINCMKESGYLQSSEPLVNRNH